MTSGARRSIFEETNPEEVWADQFAAALLMPEREVRRLWRRNRSVIELAYTFDVPVEIVRYRLDMLGLAVTSKVE